MTALTLDPAADIRPVRVNDAALGDDADTLRRAAVGQLNSITGEGRVYMSRLALLQTFEEHSSSNWDGYGARAASFAAFEKAWQLIQELPTHAPVPEFFVHPDGEIALEWTGSRGNVLTATLSDDVWLKWAALIGGERLYGRIPFSGTLPPRIRALVSTVTRASDRQRS